MPIVLIDRKITIFQALVVTYNFGLTLNNTPTPLPKSLIINVDHQIICKICMQFVAWNIPKLVV